MRRPAPAVRLVALVSLCAGGGLTGLTGCSDDATTSAPSTTGTTVPGRPITPDEAGRLADTLLNNNEAGGASVTAVVPYGVATISLNGDIDWKDHVGRVHLHSEVTGNDTTTGTGTGAAGDFDIVWTSTVVVQPLAGLADALRTAGLPAASWVSVPLDPTTSPLHVVLGLITSASSIQRDNPIGLLSKDIRWLRSDTIDGTAVDVFNLGRSTYWVDASAVLHRIDAQLASTNSTAAITFSSHGARTIDTPADVVAASDIPDIYARLSQPR